LKIRAHQTFGLIDQLNDAETRLSKAVGAWNNGPEWSFNTLRAEITSLEGIADIIGDYIRLGVAVLDLSKGE